MSLRALLRTLRDLADGGWVCPMHPDVRADAPGVCPKCHMKLVPVK